MPSLADVDLPSLETALAGAGVRPCHAMTILRQFMNTGECAISIPPSLEIASCTICSNTSATAARAC